jgi:hypothetical protein
VYAWHGTAVSPDVITDPSSVTFERIEGEADAKARRAMVERYGRDRFGAEKASRAPATKVQVDVDPSVFATDAHGGSNDRLLLVSDDPERATLALQQAARRFAMVTQKGREITPDGGGPEVDFEESMQTPSYVSEVGQSRRGPWLYVDCSGHISAPMRDAFLAIIRDEMARVGLTQGRLEHPARNFLE